MHTEVYRYGWRYLPIITRIPQQRYIRHPKMFDVTLQRYDTVTPRPFNELDYIIMYYIVLTSIYVYFPHILDLGTVIVGTRYYAPITCMISYSLRVVVMCETFWTLFYFSMVYREGT